MNRQKYFADAFFYRKAIKIALPVMLQMLIQNLVSLIDNFMVSGLGDIKMSVKRDKNFEKLGQLI